MTGRENKRRNDQDPNALLTSTSLAQSLAPPRAHPLQSSHRSLLCNQDPRKASHMVKHTISSSNHRDNHRYKARLEQILHSIYTDTKYRMAHPHISIAPDSGDSFTRSLGSLLPLWCQHYARDHGLFRSISDYGVAFAIPSLAIMNPKASQTFLDLTRKKKNTVFYGNHPSQYMDLFFPETNHRGMVFFVHGGAWGSGMPWMYRLCAVPFLKLGLVVCIVGYRTYPDGHVQDQVDDLDSAYQYLRLHYSDLFRKRPKQNTPIAKDDNLIGTVLMGHSSGSHISLLWLVQQVEKALSKTSLESIIHFDHFVGLSGVYNISHHFDYEAGRGVEELSPLKPACGGTRDHFQYYSPAVRLKNALSMTEPVENNFVFHTMPRILLVHGIDDSTVPFTSTAEAGQILRCCGVRDCREYYVPNCGHPDVVMQLMLEGKTGAVVSSWLQQEMNTSHLFYLHSNL
jgi:acetyl esterase/lipase